MKIVEAKLSDLLLASCRSELQQQSHCIRVARNRVRPQSPLKLQVVVEE
jgi:hypothetical protein